MRRATRSTRRVAAADGPKTSNFFRDPKFLLNLAIETPVATALIIVNTLSVKTMYGGPNGHTGDANMTSLSIRLTVPLREVITRGALAQRTAFARASCEQHVHSPCPCAFEARCSL